MSMILHRHGVEGRPVGPVRSARPAWVAVICVPIALVVAVFLALTVFHSVGEKDLTVWETFSFFAVQSVVLFTAPVAGVVLGVRAAISGNRSATVAAGIAVAMLIILLIVLASGGFFDTTPSVTTGAGAWAQMSLWAGHG